MRHLDLFSGIGGFSLGLERAGFTTIAFCEKDLYCQRILTKHWPYVPIYSDIRMLPSIETDVLTAGFPCQDVSYGGRGGSIHHPRTGLWYEAFRRIRDIRPKYTILENVPGLFRRGFGRVLRDLASIGYDAEWHCIPASSLGAPHVRNRVWIVAYPTSIGLQGSGTAQLEEPQLPIRWGTLRRYRAREGTAQWQNEPSMDRMVDGIPNWVDRVRTLGNSIVPQMAHYLGMCIKEHDRLLQQR